MNKISVVHVIGILAIGGVEKRLLSLVKKQLVDEQFSRIKVVYFYEGNLVDDFVDLKSDKFELINAQGNHISRIFKLIRSLKDVDILHLYNFSGILTGCLASYFISRKIKIVSHVGGIAAVFSPLKKMIEKFIFCNTSVFVYNSESTRKVYESKGITRENALVLHNGIELSEFGHKINEINDGTIRFISVGRINRNKNIEFNLRLLKRLFDMGYELKYDVIGDGAKEYIDILKKYVDDLGLMDLVVFHGYVNKPLDTEAFKNADFVFCCSFSETFGLSVVEAMSNKIVPIVSSIGGLPEVVNKGQAGIILPSIETTTSKVKDMVPVKQVWNSAYSLVVEIKDVSVDESVSIMLPILNDRELYLSFSNKAYSFSKRFSIDVYHSEVLSLYKGLQ
ncbi:glycosyltransferase family 4 protein [Vibrio breoganii]